MHEFSLARSLLKQVLEIAQGNGGGTITEVHIRCGPLAGIEPLLLSAAFDQLRQQWQCESAELKIADEPLTAICRDCRQTFEPVRFRFVCPHCGSCDTLETAGDQIMIESVVLEQPGWKNDT